MTIPPVNGTIEPIPPYVPPFSPTPMITPFTYRDGVTYLERIELLVKYVNTVIVPFVNDNMSELSDAFTKEVNRLIEEFNRLVEMIVDDSIEVQDIVVAEIFQNAESLTRQVTDLLYADKSVEDELNNRLSDANLDLRYAQQSVEDTVNTGRLTDASLDAKYAGKAVENTVNSGRLSAASLDAAYAQQSIEDIVTTGRLTTASLDATYAQQAIEDIVNSGRLSSSQLQAVFGGAARSPVTNKFYKMFAGTIRNTGTGWALITDSGHQSFGIDSVSQDATSIRIDYAGLDGLKVVTAVIVPDETLTGYMQVGSSVGTGSTYIYLKQRVAMADYVSYNGSAWVSLKGLFNVSFNAPAGVITLDHSDKHVYSSVNGNNMNVQVTARTGASAIYSYPIAATPGIANEYVAVEVRDSAGALVTSPNANMRFSIARDPYLKTLDPASVNTDVNEYAGSNIWIFGIVETAS